MMTTAPPIAADRFAYARASHLAAAAGVGGLAAGEVPTDEQLAHLAWHVAAIEPSELLHLDALARPARPRAACMMAHRQAPDDLDEILPFPAPCIGRAIAVLRDDLYPEFWAEAKKLGFVSGMGE